MNTCSCIKRRPRVECTSVNFSDTLTNKLKLYHGWKLPEPGRKGVVAGFPILNLMSFSVAPFLLKRPEFSSPIGHDIAVAQFEELSNSSGQHCTHEWSNNAAVDHNVRRSQLLMLPEQAVEQPDMFPMTLCRSFDVCVMSVLGCRPISSRPPATRLWSALLPTLVSAVEEPTSPNLSTITAVLFSGDPIPYHP